MIRVGGAHPHDWAGIQLSGDMVRVVVCVADTTGGCTVTAVSMTKEQARDLARTINVIVGES